ncbi:MAG TPA: prepilin-type N-terminal cleavage/methylation domain-containing protein [Candidatus Saccharimonadales bacterium]|nr:prepilin-type N-terminal cleavage/methylation domain-containing protein [Candidatus Saccharimonadales bacterium]
MNREAGFSLIEMLLVVAIMASILAISVPVYERFVWRDDMDLAAQNLATTFRRAEDYARSGYNDSAWSVEIQSSGMTLFMGTSFAGRNTNYDEAISFPGDVTPSGGTEVQFAKFTGLPGAANSVTLTSTTGDNRTVAVSAKGVVSY